MPQTGQEGLADPWTRPSQSTEPSNAREQGKDVKEKTLLEPWSNLAAYLVIGLDIAFVQGTVFSIASKHNQTHQTAQAQDDLLAWENHITGPERTQGFGQGYTPKL